MQIIVYNCSTRNHFNLISSRLIINTKVSSLPNNYTLIQYYND